MIIVTTSYLIPICLSFESYLFPLDLLVCLYMRVDMVVDEKLRLSTAVAIDALISPKVTFLILTVTT